MRKLIICALLAACTLGCGGGKGRVKGRVVENGSPVTVEGQAAVMFYLIGEDGKPDPTRGYPVPLNEDGSFELVASGGQVPPGNYLITVEVNGPKSATGMGRFKGRFSYPDSPLRQEVKGGRNNLTVDLGLAPRAHPAPRAELRGA